MTLAVVVLVVLCVAAVTAMGVAWSRERRRGLATEVEMAELRTQLERNTELEGQLAQALDAMDMGVVLVRADGTVVFRNDAADVFAAARHGKALVEAATQELLAKALAGEPSEREVDLFGPPSTSFMVRTFPLSTEVDAESGPIGALVLIEETTELRRIDQVRRDFVANISHELRTPIGAMGLLAETIDGEPDPETVQRLSRRMVAEAGRVSRTIDDLLELARIEFGDETQIELVRLADVVGEAVDRLRAAADQREIRIEVVVDGAPAVRGDRRQLVSALSNLLDNAVKFTPAGGVVVVEARVRGASVTLSVTDTGVGIPTRDLDRVFERFYRVDRARSRETGGTGLGLAIVRHVASNHGGEVTVSSREGEGSAFTLVLPLDADVDEEYEARRRASAPARRLEQRR